MANHRQASGTAIWRSDLDAMIRGMFARRTVMPLRSYAIILDRTMPARQSARPWIMALATAGLLVLFVLYAARLTAGYLAGTA